MEDEVVRIAKKMDKMVQKKNAVSERVPGAGRGRDRDPGPRGSRSGPGGPRALPASTSGPATPAPGPAWEPSAAGRMGGGRRRLP